MGTFGNWYTHRRIWGINTRKGVKYSLLPHELGQDGGRPQSDVHRPNQSLHDIGSGISTRLPNGSLNAEMMSRRRYYLFHVAYNMLAGIADVEWIRDK